MTPLPPAAVDEDAALAPDRRRGILARPVPASPGGRRLSAMSRRAAGVLVAIGLLWLTLPLLVLAALAIRLESAGPVLTGEPHLGRAGRCFPLLSLRCTRGGGRPGPPSVSSLGRLIRCLRIDQLPVLVNVLRGDMALIGPAPVPWDAASRGALPGRGPSHAGLTQPGLSGWMRTF